MTRVLNLRTSETQDFTCEPRVAVVAAHEQSKGNFNTWTYDLSQAQITTNGRTVYCGDFSALLEEQIERS